MKFLQILKKSAVENNPTFIQLLGMCPTLAVTTSLKNGVSMGIAVTLVLICSNFLISLLRKVIPNSIRIASFIVIISAFVTSVQLLIQAYFPSIHESLGIFIPLIVVNCIVLGRAEAFASKNPPLESLFDGLGTGLGFTGALALMGFVRELLGGGTVFAGTPFEAALPGFEPMTIFVLPAGAFITLGFLIAAVNAVKGALKNRRAKKEGK